MSFVGGQLKLKGNETLKGGMKKKKKKSDGAGGSGSAAAAAAASKALTVAAGAGGDAAPTLTPSERKAILEGYSLEGRTAPDADHRTEAERKHDALMRQREEERLRKLATKSHRDRVKEFNEHLANLTEHYDIPKVGPG